MSGIVEISPSDAKRELEAGEAVFLDIRDPQSYAAGRIPGAVALNDSNVDQFVGGADKAARLIVYCYHGHSSLGGVAFFQERGFTDVVSMSGGFEIWRSLYPDQVTT
jgi:thiosulfate sulfurtransferase